MEGVIPMQRRWTKLLKAALSAVLLLAGAGVASQAQSASLGLSILTELQTLATHAGTVFVGQIVSITHKGGVVEITFRVDQAVAGVPGKSFMLREWAGLWPAGHSRYTVGQRVLAFIHTASGVGLSSPVHGAEGLVPVVVQGVGAPQLLDVRRIAAAVVRAPNTPLPTEADAGILLSDALRVVSSQNSGTEIVPVRRGLPTRGKPPLNLPPMGQLPRAVEKPVLPTLHGPLLSPVLTGSGYGVR